MRLLFFSSIFPRPWNVTKGPFCFQACRSAQRLGHDVRVVSPLSWLERRGPRKYLKGLAELEVVYPRWVYPPKVLHRAGHHFMELSCLGAMRRLHHSWRPDAILSYWAHPEGAVAAHFARRWGIPSGVIVGGSDVLVIPRQDPARKPSIVKALREVDAVITVGKDLAEATQRLSVPAEKIHVVYQGIDAATFNPGSMGDARKKLGLPIDGKVLVSVANLLPVKGHDVLLESFAQLHEKRTDIRLFLVGGGPSRSALEAQATRLGIGGIVTFVGSVPQAELGDWYRAADLSVLASRSEGVPNALRESLACGTPFVATNVGGVHEIAEGTTSRLVPPEDPHTLARAIMAALEAPRPEPSTFPSWEESTRQMLDLLARST